MENQEEYLQEEQVEKKPEEIREDDLPQIITDKVLQIRKRLGTTSRTPTRYVTLQKEIKRLSQTPFDIQEFHNHEVVNGLFMITPQTDIIKETEKRARKWYLKRGKLLGTLAYHNFIAFHVIDVTLTHFFRQIRQFTKMKGSDMVMPNAFARKLLSILPKKSLPEWTAIIEKEITHWNDKHGTPKEDLRVYAHIITKLLTRKP